MKITMKRSELFYYLFFVSLLMAKGIGLYDGQLLYKGVLIVAGVAWIGKILLTEYTKREAAIVTILVVMGAVSYLVSGEKGALLCVLLITGLKNINIKGLFHIGMVVWGVCFGGMFLLHTSHLLEGPFKVHEKYGLGMLIRWGLGYSHPNVLHISYLVFAIFLLYLVKDKNFFRTFTIVLVGNVIIFLYSLSSTGFIVVNVYLCLSLYWKFRKNLTIVEKAMIQLLLPICLLYSLLLPITLEGQGFEILNKLVNTRLNLSKHFLTNYAPTLFGVSLEQVTTSQLTMDNSYVFAFVLYGGILFALLVYGYVLLIHRLCKEKETKKLAVVLSCLIGGLTEPFLFNTSFKNLSLLFFKDLMFEEEKECSISFLSGYNEEVTFEVGSIKKWVEETRSVLKKKQRAVFMVSLLLGISCMLGYTAISQKPDRVIVPQSACDIAVLQRNRDNIEYVEPEELIQEETDRIYGNTGKDKMIVYRENIGTVEYIREILAVFLLTAFGTMVLTGTIITSRNKVLSDEKGINCK